jgi:hypothetical protein
VERVRRKEDKELRTENIVNSRKDSKQADKR